jgi:hypothetical protein
MKFYYPTPLGIVSYSKQADSMAGAPMPMLGNGRNLLQDDILSLPAKDMIDE